MRLSLILPGHVVLTQKSKKESGSLNYRMSSSEGQRYPQLWTSPRPGTNSGDQKGA